MSTHSFSPPRIERRGAASQLIVEDRPFLVRGGEIHNSASTGRRHMAGVWPKLQQLNLNTVLAAVPWDLIEPEEGKFDFSLVDALIEEARACGMKLVPLWFGTWKNGLTHYAPHWVKADTARFTRCRISGGDAEVVTPLSDAARDADARAFAALLAHIRVVDREQQTVVMVQVENEVGLFGAQRDHSEIANRAFNATVDPGLITYLQQNWDDLLPETREMTATTAMQSEPTWAELFPGHEHAEEAFMAWHYAKFIGHVAAAGKSEYDLPMFVNAALDSPVPGVVTYFRGGPVAHMADIWRAGAPSLDLICPDIYHADYNDFLEKFNRARNPLFVPESWSDAQGAANALYTLGKGGIGYSPFGIESRTDIEEGPLAPTYALIEQLAPLVLQHQSAGSIEGLRVSPTHQQDTVSFGGFEWIANRLAHWRSPDVPHHEFGGCLIMQTDQDEFIVAGFGVQLRFRSTSQPGHIVGISRLDEMLHVDGEWVADRRLSGDEIMQSYDVATLIQDNQNGTQVKFWDSPGVLRVKLYSYPR